MIFHKPQNKIHTDLKVTINDCEIERVNSFKYLGIYMDECMTFNDHFDHVSSKLTASIGCLNTIKNYVTEQVFIILINCFVYSVVDYGLPIWGSVVVKNKLEILQRKIDNLIKTYYYPVLSKLYTKQYWSKKVKKMNNDNANTNKLLKMSRSIDRNVLLEKCNLLSITERYNYYCIVTVFQIIKFESVVPKLNLMYNVIKIRGEEEMSSLRLEVKRCPSTIMQHSVQYQSVLLWNSLPRTLRCKDIGETSFKSHLNQWCIASRLDAYVTDL